MRFTTVLVTLSEPSGKEPKSTLVCDKVTAGGVETITVTGGEVAPWWVASPL